MKFSPTAAAQMYPHLVKVTCEAHDEQSRAKVPHHLKAVFASRDNPDFACRSCVDEAKKQWDDNQRNIRRQRTEEKEAARAAVKQARIDAREADDALLSHIKLCEESEKTVSSSLQALDSTRSLIKAKTDKLATIRDQIRALDDVSAAIQEEVLNLSEKSLDQFEALEASDTSVAKCYTDLKAALDTADTLWDSLGKSTRKKRDKKSRRAATVALRARDEQENTKDSAAQV